jgi:hypothetical protein
MLHGRNKDALEAEMRSVFPQLKRTSYGKQVIAIEKLLFGGPQPMILPHGPVPHGPANGIYATRPHMQH